MYCQSVWGVKNTRLVSGRRALMLVACRGGNYYYNHIKKYFDPMPHAAPDRLDRTVFICPFPIATSQPQSRGRIYQGAPEKPGLWGQRNLGPWREARQKEDESGNSHGIDIRWRAWTGTGRVDSTLVLVFD